MKNTSTFLLAILLILAFNFSSNAQVSGIVFRDFNANELRITSYPTEPLMAGIIVTAYNSSDAVVLTTNSRATGTYAFKALKLPLHIDFKGFANADFQS